MKIFKFGGASIKDASGVKNIAEVLRTANQKNLVIVVSAMGKTTNLLEKVVTEYLKGDSAKCSEYVFEFKQNHLEILKGLFENPNHRVYHKTSELFQKMNSFLDVNKSKNHAFVYDQVVSFGELVSSTIVCEYLSEIGMHNYFLDVRRCIKTDANYRDANVDWEATQKKIQKKVNASGITITQGFLGSETTNNFTTTLGREGSDYTAAI